MTPTSDSLQWKKNCSNGDVWAFFELFFVRVYWEIPVLIITFWTQFFITIKHLAVFLKILFNTETLEIFLLLKHFSCWLSAPYFGKLYGSRQIQDIHCMKESFYKIFVLNISVFCTFSFFLLKIVKYEALLSPRDSLKPISRFLRYRCSRAI